MYLYILINVVFTIAAQTGSTKAAIESNSIQMPQNFRSNGSSNKLTRICTLLMCTIDYMGFRFEAVALTPIDDTKTLIYGRKNKYEHISSIHSIFYQKKGLSLKYSTIKALYNIFFICFTLFLHHV